MLFKATIEYVAFLYDYRVLHQIILVVLFVEKYENPEQSLKYVFLSLHLSVQRSDVTACGRIGLQCCPLTLTMEVAKSDMFKSYTCGLKFVLQLFCNKHCFF